MMTTPLLPVGRRLLAPWVWWLRQVDSTLSYCLVFRRGRTSSADSLWSFARVASHRMICLWWPKRQEATPLVSSSELDESIINLRLFYSLVAECYLFIFYSDVCDFRWEEGDRPPKKICCLPLTQICYFHKSLGKEVENLKNMSSFSPHHLHRWSCNESRTVGGFGLGSWSQYDLCYDFVATWACAGDGNPVTR